MIRILLFFLVILALGLGLTWLADRPGDLVVTFGGYRYEVTLVVAAALVVAFIAAIIILWWIIRAIWTSPHAVARYFRGRRRDRGYKALSTGLIAAGAGDGGLARRMGRQSAKLISSRQEPLIHLLDAQAALLEGDHESARAKFNVMAENPDTRLLGLRGLYLEAQRLGEREAARHYAAQAAEAAPQLGWAVDATLDARTEERDWQGALALIQSQKPTRPEDQEQQLRRRAVLLTAQAMEQLDTDPAAAREAAIEANRLQPAFVPAAVTAARALLRQNDLRRASKVLEAAWKKEPHPELAEVYVHARPGDSTHDRLGRARKLARMRANHVESELLVARAALDAGEFAQARAAAEAAVRIEPREGAFLLLADIEEAETGDQGRVRHWLAKAVRAPRDPAWVADGFVSERWAPASPVTGELDAFEWRAPMERLGQVVEGEEALAALPPVEAEPVEPEDEPGDTAVVTVDAEPADASTEEEGEAETPPEAEAEQPQEAETVEAETVPAEEEEEPEATRTQEPAVAVPEDAPPQEEEEQERAPSAAQERKEPEEVRPPLPDDPGIEPDESKTDNTRRFRLF